MTFHHWIPVAPHTDEDSRDECMFCPAVRVVIEGRTLYISHGVTSSVPVWCMSNEASR